MSTIQIWLLVTVSTTLAGVSMSLSMHRNCFYQSMQVVLSLYCLYNFSSIGEYSEGLQVVLQ